MMTKNHRKNICFRWFFKPLPICAVFLIFILCQIPANAFEIAIGTGEAGTFSHHTGRAVCRIINKYADDISCKTVPGMDAVDNLTNLQGGSMDLCLADLRTLNDAMNKTGNFAFFDIHYDNIRTIIPLYDIPIALVARSDSGIDSLQTLPGRRINIGSPRSPQRLAIETIMKAKNWSKADFSLVQELSASQSQDTMAFCHATIQALVHIGIHPDPKVNQLFKLCGAQLIAMDDTDIEKLTSDHPAFSKIIIPSGTYPSLESPVTTFGTRMMLVASDSLDEETVYQIIEVLDGHKQNLRQGHAVLAEFSVERLEESDTGIKLHPGAVRFFSAQ
jgi:TRAP transporter TAXI family solute receptor